MMPKDPEEMINNANNEAKLPEVKAEVAAEEAGAGEAPPSLSAAEQKAADYLASWQRAQADFINYKRRTEQERQDFIRSANASLILSLLPALDDLERALGALPETADAGWAEGIRLVERKFKAILEAQGVKPILALGMAFDPSLHEAVRQDRGPEGVVVQEFQKGYTLNDKLLRPARVVVGDGSAEDEPE